MAFVSLQAVSKSEILGQRISTGLPIHFDRLRADKLRAAAAGASNWLTTQLASSSLRQLNRGWIIPICAVIFLTAVGVRLLHWQDKHVEIIFGKTSLSGVFTRYEKEARRMLEERRILFPRELPAAGDARMLTHPPGYPIILAAIFRFTDDPYPALWLLQILCDGLAAVLVFLIASQLLNRVVATIAAMLVALSPHLAHYSLLPLPDSLAVLPILIAVYLIVRARKRPNVWLLIAAGACIGLSCWLRANALLLAPFLSFAVLFVFERRSRVLYAGALTAAAIVVISPITIRNLVVFHRLIPISIQAGLNLVEGIGDFDPDGKLGMPRSDREARLKDAEWHGRPEYAATLWTPDGIARDRERFDRGMSVIRSNSGWFAGVVLRRGAFMLSYNESGSRDWPFSTASIPPVSRQPGYGHSLEAAGTEQRSPATQPALLVLNGALITRSLAVTADRDPVASISPGELNANGAVVSKEATVSLRGDGRVFELAGDGSPYGDQFESAPIPVKENTDYVLVLPVNVPVGDMALKVTSPDRRIALAIAASAAAVKETQPSSSSEVIDDTHDKPEMVVIQMPFASGARTEVRLVLSNNGATHARPAAQLGRAEFFEMGPTPYVWTGYARPIVRSIQRKFTTGLITGLISLGIVLLLLSRGARTLVILLAVPAYYLLVQSPLHTEYRYILAIHYFVFMLAATSIYFVASVLTQGALRVYNLTARH